jgi:hypothetical protein
MTVQFHPHALERMAERGATQEEVIATVQTGESFAAKFGRTGFRKRFAFRATWRGEFYENKELEVFAVPANDGWLVITVVTRYD